MAVSKENKKGLMQYMPTYSFSQPAHIAASSVALIGMAAYWKNDNLPGSPPPYLGISHFMFSAGWFGTQFWVTFIAGLTMFHNLPRHTFGNVQFKLFPKYFTFGMISNAICLGTYVFHHSLKNLDMKQYIQVGCLVFSFIANFANLYLLPYTKGITDKRNKIEKEFGLDQHIGTVPKEKLEELYKFNSTYKQLHAQFMRIHGVSSLLNLTSLVASLVHLYCLGGHLSDL